MISYIDTEERFQLSNRALCRTTRRKNLGEEFVRSGQHFLFYSTHARISSEQIRHANVLLEDDNSSRVNGYRA